MELKKEKEVFCEQVLSDKTRINVDEDIIVPDTMPDVLKVLEVDVRTYITDSGTVSGGLYVQGKVYINILYIPDCADSDCPECIKASYDFKSKTEKAQINSDMKLSAKCDVSRVDFSAINSRKLSVKSILSIDYCIYSQKELELLSDIENDSFECVLKDIPLEKILSVENCEFEVSDTTKIAENKKQIAEIIKTDIKIVQEELKASDGKLIIKGMLMLSALYKTDEKKLDCFMCEVPFTELFDVDAINEESRIIVELSVGEYTVSVSEDDDGDMRIINIDALLNASMRAYIKSEIKIIDDCFCPGFTTVPEYKNEKIRCVCDDFTSMKTVHDVIGHDSKSMTVLKIYNVIAEPEINKAEASNGIVTLSGKLKAYVLYITDNSKCPVYSIKKDIPFEYSFESECAKQGMEVSVCLQTGDISYGLNSAGDIDLRVSLKVQVKVIDLAEVMLIENLTTKIKADNSEIVIYFVKDGDTLWNIAKKYSVCIESIKNMNSIEGDCIAEGNKLIIPF